MLRAMDDGPPAFVEALYVVFPVLFVLVLGFIVYTSVRNARALKKAGYDPLTAQVQMADRLSKGFEGTSLEARLAELDDLHARGVISA